MSKLRLAQSVIALGLWLAAALPSVGCSCTHIGGTCDTTDDCLTRANYGGKGTECVEGFCKCPDKDGLLGEPCCPDGRMVCPREDFECRTSVECEHLLVAAYGCFPSPECTSDADCPGPPDPRCGRGRCMSGRCELDIKAGQPIESQYPGDCTLLICSITGETMQWPDPNDPPLDGNLCTHDLCKAGEPHNPPMPNHYPCQAAENGFCAFGQCVECFTSLGVACTAGFKCLDDRCIPEACFDFAKGNQETDVDCGGPECGGCGAGFTCIQPSDCQSGVCAMGICQAPTHSDGVKNGDETGKDCGYPLGLPFSCPDGEGCAVASDCESNVCFDGICQPPSCLDTVQNGSETGKDCGGTCLPCPG